MTDESKKQLQTKIKDMSSKQIGELVLVNIELRAYQQILTDENNILTNEVNQLRKKLEKYESDRKYSDDEVNKIE
jgi:regulator of replication initiation timing